MSILHAGEIGRFNSIPSLLDSDYFTIYRDGVLYRIDGEEARNYFSSGELTYLTVADSPYTVLSTDKTIIVDKSGGDVTINPIAIGFADEKVVTVVTKDNSANSWIWNAAVNEDDSATVSTQGTSLSFLPDQTNEMWRIV